MSGGFFGSAAATARHAQWPSDDHRCYRVFGSVLRSTMELPELLEVDMRTAPRWSFRVDAGPPPVADAVRLGERRIGPEAYSLSRSALGFRLEYSHAGVFDVSADGTQIVWYTDKSDLSTNRLTDGPSRRSRMPTIVTMPKWGLTMTSGTIT